VIYIKYLWSLLRHKWYVFVAGGLCKVPFWRRVFHDWSKFTPTEFGRYARWNVGGSRDKREWATAWHHHLRFNDHHPEHWLLPWNGSLDFYAGIGSPVAEYVVALPMPEVCVRDLVADHLGAARARTGSWEASQWFNENRARWHLHPYTSGCLSYMLINIGYTILDDGWVEGPSFKEWAKAHA